SARSLLKETAAHLMAADREMLDTLLVRTRAWLGDAFDQAWAEGYAIQGKAAALAMVSCVVAASERSSAPELTASVPARIHADTLTAREREVAALVARGYSNREIAQALTVTVKTVEAHLTRILAKLGVASRVQVAICAPHRHHSERSQTRDP
ncbi:MAG TPA: LuxR C-terminal-related transcriptional regulator, partial [Herpetosiphonaceae bacterium]